MPEKEASPGSGTKTEVEHKTRAETGIQIDVESEIGPNLESGSGTRTEAKLEAGVRTRLESGSRPEPLTGGSRGLETRTRDCLKQVITHIED